MPHLYEFAGEHREEGLALQSEVSELQEELKQAIEWTWERKSTNEDEPREDSFAYRMEEAERKRLVNPVDKIDKPALGSSTDWKLRLLDLSS